MIDEHYTLEKWNSFGIDILYDKSEVIDNGGFDEDYKYGPVVALNWDDEYIYVKRTGSIKGSSTEDITKTHYFIITKKDQSYVGSMPKEQFNQELKQLGRPDIKLLSRKQARERSHQEYPDQPDVEFAVTQKNTQRSVIAILLFILYIPTSMLALLLSDHSKKTNKQWKVWRLWLLSWICLPVVISYFLVFLFSDFS